MNDNFEKSIINEGHQLFSAVKNEKESLFDKDAWLGRMMSWVMKDPSFKVDLFRFVDVLPVLSTKDQVAKHIQEYLLKKDRELPLLMGTALKAASFSLARGLAATAIRKNVTDMAQRFIMGRDIFDAERPLKKLYQNGFSFTIDLLGEKTLSEQEADSYLERYQHLILALPNMISGFSSERANTDPANVSIKVSALSCHLQEEDPSFSISDAKKRIIPLLRLAKLHGVFINFDVESFQTHEIVCELFNEIASSDEFRSFPHLGIVVQAYLRESEAHVRRLIQLCKERGAPITVRLVKGAYWDYEVVKAEQLGHKCPVFSFKAETDRNYESLSKLLLNHAEILTPAFGSHNIRSLAHAIAYAKNQGIDKNLYEIQMLYGMAEAERSVLLARGHRVRIYVPLGEMLPGMSYLVRRLLENTSQMGFLKLSHHDHKNEEALLKAPMINGEGNNVKRQAGFINTSSLDFTEKSARDLFARAIAIAQKSLPIQVPIVIAGVAHDSINQVTKLCPSDLTLNVSTCSLARIEHAEKAVETCAAVSLTLQRLSLSERALHLLNLAKILEDDRYQLSAIICIEVGKTWAEADADVIEAIDFCRYYAELAQSELAHRKMGDVGGEHNILSYQGRGPTVVIAPWNFPIAILCGMSVAAYVAGNPIIMKPAEQSSATAYLLYERMMKASFLKDAVQFLPGLGEDIGPYLVSHRKIANICFTGSMKVGHQIVRAANTVVDGQLQMKRVISEMGGKNTIIIDDDADLDEAVVGVIKSAFIYAGQKCSAASRVVVIGAIKDQFIERLVEATKSLRVGSAIDPSSFMGPVIDQEAFERLNQQSQQLEKDTSVKVCYVGNKMEGGYYVPAMIVETKDATHWVMQEELFGPIIAIFHASDLDTALSIANDTKYALTGAIFSRSPDNIACARERFDVGNLYINQKCTGAMVGRQPFGGFKMSGTGLKAGGPNYLLNFVDAKVVSENTMRRGFTPEVSV